MVDSWLRSDIDKMRRRVDERVRARLHVLALVGVALLAAVWVATAIH